MRTLLAIATTLLLSSLAFSAGTVSGTALLEVDDEGLFVAIDTDGDGATDRLFTFFPREPLQPMYREFDRLEVTLREGDDGVLIIRGEDLYLELHVATQGVDRVPEHRSEDVILANGIELGEYGSDRWRAAPWRFDRSAVSERPDGKVHDITCKRGTDLVGADDQCTAGGPGSVSATIGCNIGFGSGSIGTTVSITCAQGYYACAWCKLGVSYGRCRSMTCSDHFNPEEP